MDKVPYIRMEGIHCGGLASGSSRLNNVMVTLDVYRMMGRYYGLAQRPAFHKGIRALQCSYLAEWLMQKRTA